MTYLFIRGSVLPDAKLKNPENSGIFFLKSGKFSERFFRINCDCLKCIVLNQIITDVILYLHKIYLNEITGNRHQNIVN